ncbi:MAG: hypothetical protein ACH34U_14405, partial [Cyanobium sp.]
GGVIEAQIGQDRHNLPRRQRRKLGLVAGEQDPSGAERSMGAPEREGSEPGGMADLRGWSAEQTAQRESPPTSKRNLRG